MSPESSQTIPSGALAAEPSAGRQPVPVWLIILGFVLLFCSMVYFDQHGGWFDRQVYTPYVSVKQVEDMWPKDDAKQLIEEGRKLFSVNCAVCHMENGVGNPANGCPPLVGSEWVKNPGPGRIVRIISKGLIGPIEVAGKPYGTGTMLPVGDGLQGDEKEKCRAIAAIASYVRKTFGGIDTPVTAEQVQVIRAQITGRTASYTAQELMGTAEKD
jgi:mono/diheme cytochrome c family protein